MARTVGELVGRWALTEPAPEQPLELPVPVLARSARDRLIPPNASTYQYYSLVLGLTSGTYVFPQKYPCSLRSDVFLKPPTSSRFVGNFS